MGKARKVLALMLALVLVVAMFAVAGCSSTDDAAVDEPAVEERGAVTGVADLIEGDRIAVQSGTTGEAWATENLKPNGIEVVPYDDILLAFSALQAGDVLGVINDLPISQDVVKDEARGLEIVEEIKTDETYGFAFSKENIALRDAVNWGLAQVIASGEYATIYELWFGGKPMSMPEATSAAAKPAATPKTLTAGKIIVGSDTAYPPFENVEDGKTVGFDVDLMTAIGKQLGLTVEFKSYKFDALITGVQAGSEFDMVGSAMTITDERKQSIDFSDPYINSNQSLAVKKAN